MDEVERQQTTGSSMQPLLGKQATPLEGKPHQEIKKKVWGIWTLPIFGHCPNGQGPLPNWFRHFCSEYKPLLGT